MTSLNPPCLMAKILMRSFSIVIIALSFVICEAKHLKTLSQKSLNTPILNSKNSNNYFLSHYNLSIQGSINAVSRSLEDFGPVSEERGILGKRLQSATAGCQKLMSLASYNLNMSLPTSVNVPSRKTLTDFRTNICASLAYIETCSDEFEYAPDNVRNMVLASLDSSRKSVSNSLSILSTIDDNGGSVLTNGGSAWPPSWVTTKVVLFDSFKKVTVDVVVAKDGSGRFKTISEAINLAPVNNAHKFVIYVKQGKYYENVRIGENRWNIIMVGDGMDKTIVSGHFCNRSGESTFNTATFAVYGRGFIGRNMGFENTAGASGGQAVAFLSASDKSILFKCSISGYQDTLFPVSGRQFYRECRISGTVDFIFGMASAVFQSCTILVKKPGDGHYVYITANGKSTPSCPSGFSIQKSSVVAEENLRGVRTFLGRPWRRYATTVSLESYLGGFIDPQGWSRWDNSQDLPDTVYYGEYGNTGRGAVTSRRMRMKGVRPKMSNEEAQNFTVRNLIGGDNWLSLTGYPYQPDL
ncbi:hypothetical protein ACS0TY_010668 [Phlomoides rotata]